MVDLTQQRNVQIIAPLVCAQDSAVIIADFEECKVECTECVQSPNIILRNLRDVILRVKPEGSYCHPGGFTDGRRVNECEPSPVSEQIEHTKTECLYAKLCEREVNPRQFISGSYQSCDSTHSRSNSEHTSQNAKELLKEGNNNKINCNIHRASGRVCLLLPKSLISCKMASRNNFNLSYFFNTVNSELFWFSFFFLPCKKRKKSIKEK